MVRPESYGVKLAENEGKISGKIMEFMEENFVRENGGGAGEFRRGERISRWGVSRWNFARGKFAFPQGRGGRSDGWADRGDKMGDRQRTEEELQWVVRGGERELSAGRKMTREGGGGGDGGTAVRRRRWRWRRRRLEDGGIVMRAEKNRGHDKEWRRSS